MNDKSIVAQSHVNDKHDPAHSMLNGDLLKGFSHIMAYLGRNNDLTESEKANFADTAVRAAKAFAGQTATRSEINEQLREILATGFPREHSAHPPGIITQGPISVHSYCPHHLLPVEYQAYVAYIPGSDGKVLGLSKLARITILLGRRPVLQEQLAADIANVLSVAPADSVDHNHFPGIDSAGSAVLLTGKHSCMTCRGVHSDALTSVSELRGKFYEEGFEQKFYQAIDAINSSSLR